MIVVNDGAGDIEAVRPRKPGWWRWGKRVLQIGIPVAVVWLVWHEIRSLDLGGVREALVGADGHSIVYGVLSAFVALVVAGLYDGVAFPKGQAGVLGFRHRWLLGSILFGWTNFIAVGPMGGPALRLLAYRKYGLTGAEITRGLVGLYLGLSSGFVAWQLAAWFPGPQTVPGYVMRAAIALVGSVACTIAGRSIVIPLLRKNRYGGELDGIPVVRLGVISFIEWGLVLLCFQMLIRAGGVVIGPLESARTVLTGYACGVASMIPGGLGSADAVWFKGFDILGVEQEQGAAGILLFRAGFYLLPWLASVIVLGSVFLIVRARNRQI
ncbi:MAG: UPF0104 family protein [Planctomycetes bacterium]|nr:UPF0104 family protein [Planctomycetota bacterium]NOG54850.1 UPF0104 family protein [Planctomycetota bacterium]